MNPKQQRFAEEYVVDHNATQAAIRAGYSERTAKQQGHRLLTNVDVAGAIRAKEARLSRKIEVTVASLTEELEEARVLAMEKGHASAAVQATMGIAKLHGLLVDRQEIHERSAKDMTIEEIRAERAAVEAELVELYRERDPERAAKLEALNAEVDKLECELGADDAPPSKTRH